MAERLDRPSILFCDHRGERSQAVLDCLEALGGPVDRTTYLRHSLDALAQRAPAVLVLDTLARQGRIEAGVVDRARAEAAARTGSPVGLLLVSHDESGGPLARASVENGPWDLIAGDAPAEEWRLRIERLERERGIARRLRELAHRASHDDLTGLLRKETFQARLEEHFSAAGRHGFQLALALLDLDDFGQVNKRHDHLVGDRILRAVGEVVRGTLRAEDVAGRLGGDEFAVLLPYTGRDHAAQVLERLRAAIHDLSGAFPGAKSEIAVGSSIGFETFGGTDVESLEELRLHAERALRRSKEAGGNRATWFRGVDDAG